MKTCRKCGTTKPLSAFSPEKRMADGYRWQCRECRNADASRRRPRSPNVGRTFARVCANPKCSKPFSFVYEKGSGAQRFCSPKCRGEEFNLRCGRDQRMRKYGIRATDYDAMLVAQGGGCAICGCPPGLDAPSKSLHVDHDHACCPGAGSCGKCVRGILCVYCNNALGGYEKTGYMPEPFRAYLERTASQAVA